MFKWASGQVPREQRDEFINEVLTPANLRRVFWTIVCFLPLSSLCLVDNILYTGERIFIYWGILDLIISVSFLATTSFCLTRSRLPGISHRLVIAYYVFCLSSTTVYYFLARPLVGDTPIYAIGVVLPAVLYHIPTRQAVGMLLAIHGVYTALVLATVHPLQEIVGAWITGTFGIVIAGLAAFYLFSREWENYQQLQIIRKNNRDLLRLNTQLQEQTEEMNHIMALAAHDMRSPLLNMKGLFDVLKPKREWNRPPYAEVIQLSRDSCANLLALLKSLLDSYRVENEVYDPKREPVDLVNLLEQTRLKFLDSKTPIVVEKNAEKAIAVADPAPLQQILDNLLANAVKFSPSGSVISLSLSKNASEWIIEVADEGPGIPQDERTRLFHKFFRSSSAAPAQQGAGLGLFIVSRLASNLGGKMTYREREPHGSVFSLRLPCPHEGPAG